ncbi:hypothetical protein C8R45DRAFT_932046 [Mycena sanguinolenta]|nr:hypothetical protein C8R45DRAFT_932046 [Mycena sanguinolenta]
MSDAGNPTAPTATFKLGCLAIDSPRRKKVEGVEIYSPPDWLMLRHCQSPMKAPPPPRPSTRFESCPSRAIPLLDPFQYFRPQSLIQDRSNNGRLPKVEMQKYTSRYTPRPAALLLSTASLKDVPLAAHSARPSHGVCVTAVAAAPFYTLPEAQFRRQEAHRLLVEPVDNLWALPEQKSGGAPPPHRPLRHK